MNDGRQRATGNSTEEDEETIDNSIQALIDRSKRIKKLIAKTGIRDEKTKRGMRIMEKKMARVEKIWRDIDRRAAEASELSRDIDKKSAEMKEIARRAHKRNEEINEMSLDNDKKIAELDKMLHIKKRMLEGEIEKTVDMSYDEIEERVRHLRVKIQDSIRIMRDKSAENTKTIRIMSDMIAENANTIRIMEDSLTTTENAVHTMHMEIVETAKLQQKLTKYIKSKKRRMANRDKLTGFPKHSENESVIKARAHDE